MYLNVEELLLMTVIMDEILSIKTFFQSHSVQLSTAWLQGCVSWCKDENLPANYSPKDIQHKVFEQWLLLDLRDVEVPCLPLDLSSKTKYILEGSYSLQMMKAIDISKPKHWQLQRIRNNATKNVDSEVESSKRVLQLTLTDGVQEVEAMEYKPISCLNLNLIPGTKIRLIGPITVRRGRLMLEDKNVKVLGGEVEDLIVPNAAENVLASILKLPLNPTPNIVEESLLTANNDMFNNTGGRTDITRNQNSMANNVPHRLNPVNQSKRAPQIQNRVTNGPSTVTNPSTRLNDNQMMDLDEEEEMRIAAQIDMLMEAEQNLQMSPAKKRENKTSDPFDETDLDDSIFEQIEIPDDVESIPKYVETGGTNGEVTQTNPNISNGIHFDNDLSEIFDFDAHFTQPTKESEWKPSAVRKPPIFTIEKLKKNMPNISKGKFKIKVKFDSVQEKLSVKDDDYYLVIRVRDDSGELDVKMHPDIVSDFGECCASALMSIKTQIMENDTEAEKKFVEVLRRIKQKLLELDNIVEVQIDSKEPFPVIVNILE